MTYDELVESLKTNYLNVAVHYIKAHGGIYVVMMEGSLLY